MRASWYSKTGPEKEVIQIGELETPNAEKGEVSVRFMPQEQTQQT